MYTFLLHTKKPRSTPYRSEAYTWYHTNLYSIQNLALQT